MDSRDGLPRGALAAQAAQAALAAQAAVRHFENEENIVRDWMFLAPKNMNLICINYTV